MHVFIKKSLLQVLLSLAWQVELNVAILRYVKLLISTNVRDGHKWACKTFDHWKSEEFQFGSVGTMKRVTQNQKESDYIILIGSYENGQDKMAPHLWRKAAPSMGKGKMHRLERAFCP